MVLDHSEGCDTVESMQQEATMTSEPPPSVDTNLAYLPSGEQQFMDTQGMAFIGGLLYTHTHTTIHGYSRYGLYWGAVVHTHTHYIRDLAVIQR